MGCSAYNLDQATQLVWSVERRTFSFTPSLEPIMNDATSGILFMTKVHRSINCWINGLRVSSVRVWIRSQTWERNFLSWSSGNPYVSSRIIFPVIALNSANTLSNCCPPYTFVSSKGILTPGGTSHSTDAVCVRNVGMITKYQRIAHPTLLSLSPHLQMGSLCKDQWEHHLIYLALPLKIDWHRLMNRLANWVARNFRFILLNCFSIVLICSFNLFFMSATCLNSRGISP